MGAFQAGFQLGQSAFNQAERNRLLRVQEERTAKEFARKEQDWQKADELEAQVKGLSEQITNPNASNYRIGGSPVGLKMPGQAAPADAAPGEMPPTDFSFGPAAAGGLKAPRAFALADTPGAAVAPAPDAVGLRGSVLPAGGVSLKAGPSASEEQAILAKIALLKGDIQGFNAARERGKVESRKAELRDFSNQGQKLYNARNESPEAMEAWVQFVSPYTSMISKYRGAEFDARVNPKTGQLEVIPYDGGEVQAVSIDEAMPYLQAAFQKTSEYGDPETAVKLLNDIAAAERTRSREDSSFRLGVADKVSGSVAKAAQLEETSRHNRATEGIQSAAAANQRKALGNAYKNIREFVDAKGNTVLLDLNNLQAGADGALAIPQGLRPKTARPEVTQKDIVDYAKALVENQTRDPDAPSKPLTLDKALQVARAQLSGEGYTSAADKLVQAYLANRGQTPTAEAPKAPGLTPPARKPITTIVPPRTAADMAPKTPLSDEDITKMLATKLPAR